jgi:peroxiredoxin
MATQLRWLNTAAVVLFIAGSAVLTAADDKPEEQITGKAPDFTLKDVDGNEVTFSEVNADNVVVLEWTNYDCPFVKAHYTEEVHTMKDLAATYADRGVVWLTINSTYYVTPEAVKEWADEQGIDKQTVLVDTDGTVGKKYHAKTTPHMFVIDKGGAIVYQGAIDNSPLGRQTEPFVNYVDQALTQLLAGEDITVPSTEPYGCTVKYPPGEKPAGS